MAFVIAVLFIALFSSSYAQDKFLAVLSNDTPIYNDFYQTLKSKLPGTGSISKIAIRDFHIQESRNYDIVIAIGSDASKILSGTANIKNLIYTLIPSGLSKAINKKGCLAQYCSSILIEQPVDRYIQLFKYLFPKKKTLVIATTKSRVKKLSGIKILSEKYDVKTRLIIIEDNIPIAHTLIDNLESDDVLLALPDPAIYNKYTAKSIILSAYHKNVPIIGYSRAFADAGALVSLYSSFEDIAQQTAKLAKQLPQGGGTYYPSTFSVELNSSVAKSLNIDIGEIDELRRVIK